MTKSDHLQEQLKTCTRLIESKSHQELTRLLLCTVFQNNLVEERDYQSIIFNSSIEDLGLFSENLLEKKSLKSDDHEILVDCLISLMAIHNKDFRETIKSTFKAFMDKYDTKILELLESEIFKPLENPGAQVDEEDEEDIEISVDN